MNNKSATARGISSFPPLFRLDDSPPNTLLVRIAGTELPASRGHPSSQIGLGLILIQKRNTVTMFYHFLKSYRLNLFYHLF